MNQKAAPAIALLVEASRGFGRDLLRGIALYARTQADWSLLTHEMTLDSGIPDWLANAQVKGVIARVDKHTIEPLRKLGVPIVDVRCNQKFPGIPQVGADNTLVAEHAFNHLWERGFRHFAFCGFRFASYSDKRLNAFRDLVAQAECPLSVYESQGTPDSQLTAIEQTGMLDVEPLIDWLRSLHHPTGLFVCNDIRGQQVLNACRTAQIALPDEIGVIGVDDDDAICLLCDPPLSSVRPNAELVGYRAAEVLQAMIDGTSEFHDIEYIRPLNVAERLSTQVVALEDRELARVCRFIRQHACSGINVEDIAEVSSLSRRQLERRFRKLIGHTPHQEITAVQINRVKQLLRETEMTLEQIAHRAGYGHKESLSSVFKRETGETPGEYRSLS